MTEKWYKTSDILEIPKQPYGRRFMKRTMKTTLYLPEDLHAEIKIQAARLRMSMTKLIIQAIKHELQRLAGR